MESPCQGLGPFSDWVVFARGQWASQDNGALADLTSAQVRSVIGFPRDRPPTDVKVEDRWEADGLAGEDLSWSVGYGPRTRAWLLRPAGVREPLPGVLALHDHGAFKYFGREKVADGPKGPEDEVLEFRRHFYDGRAFANELARRGFAVLVHDAFLWGSRRFEADAMQHELESESEEPWMASASAPTTGPLKVPQYNRLAARHEHVVAKYCAVLGTTLSGVVAYEDRVALDYLRSRADVSGTRVGCIGLSGGGCRAAVLNAVSPYISAAVVVGMMSTYAALLDGLVASHTWMFFPPGLGGRWDWPDLVSCRAPSPLMVLYAREDELFTLAGMTEAHNLISSRYRKAGAAAAYVGNFYDGRHRFDREMQDDAFEFLAERLREEGGAPS